MSHTTHRRKEIMEQIRILQEKVPHYDSNAKFIFAATQEAINELQSVKLLPIPSQKAILDTLHQKLTAIIMEQSARPTTHPVMTDYKNIGETQRIASISNTVYGKIQRAIIQPNLKQGDKDYLNQQMDFLKHLSHFEENRQIEILNGIMLDLSKRFG